MRMNKRRNKRSSPIIIGLTGSIGMGKTTVSRMFGMLGVAICDSDAIVHRLLSAGGTAYEKVGKLFPASKSQTGIDRKMLGREVFAHPEKLQKLEAVLHPLVRQEQQRFIRRMKQRGRKKVLLDIPLLFETGAEERCDIVVVVSAPAFIQRQRVMARPGMTEEKFARILQRQWPDSKKRQLADYIVNTGQGRAASLRQVRNIVKTLSNHRSAANMSA